jgi:Sulfate permease family
MANTSGSPDSSFAGASNAWLVFRSLNAYRIQFLTHDLFAGLTLAAIAIPEQMATARLGGFTPQIGFFAFLAGSLAFAVFGSNRFLSCGADSTITPIFAGGLAILVASSTPEYLVLAAALALMVGLLLLAAGIFRLGWIADLLDTCDDRLSCRHFSAYPHFAIAGHTRAALSEWPNAPARNDPRRTSERNKLIYACYRLGGFGDNRHI